MDKRRDIDQQAKWKTANATQCINTTKCCKYKFRMRKSENGRKS